MSKKVSFFLHSEIKREADAERLLDKCSRRVTPLVAIALYELSEKYNLKDMSEDNLKKFIEIYDVLNKTGMSMPEEYTKPVKAEKPMPVFEEKIVEAPAESRDSLVRDKDKQNMADIMANIFVS